MAYRSGSYPRFGATDSSVPTRPLPCSGELRASTWPDFARTSTALHRRTPALVPDSPRAQRGVIDTSVVIDLEKLEADQLPIELAVSAITMAELAAGPHATGDADERARRQDRLQRAEATFDPLPFDGEAARAYGRIYAAEVGSGRTARGAGALDLLIAATACAAGLPIYTRNPKDFQGLQGLVDVVAV